MKATPPSTNRHPVDELADIRAERRRIEEREAELRNILLADGADLHGHDYRARITTIRQRRLNRDLLEQRFGPEAVAECCIPATFTFINLAANRKP
jgi:hypothetical protein